MRAAAAALQVSRPKQHPREPAGAGAASAATAARPRTAAAELAAEKELWRRAAVRGPNEAVQECQGEVLVEQRTDGGVGRWDGGGMAAAAAAAGAAAAEAAWSAGTHAPAA